MDKYISNQNSSALPRLYQTCDNVNIDTGFLFLHIYGENEHSDFHYHTYYEIFITVSGKTIHCINDNIQTLEPGCIVFVRPKDKHYYIYKQKNYEFINLALSPELLESMFAYISDATDISDLLTSPLPPVARLSSHDLHALLNRIDGFFAISNSDITTQKLNIRSFLLDIFLRYFINKKNEPQSKIPLWLEETCKQMSKPDNFIAGIKRMVSISGKTQEHLARMLRKHYNVSLSEFVNDLRLNYAVNLLLHTNLKVADICYESGFGNISSFYSLFSAVYNMSPKAFRELNSKQA